MIKKSDKSIETAFLGVLDDPGAEIDANPSCSTAAHGKIESKPVFWIEWNP